MPRGSPFSTTIGRSWCCMGRRRASARPDATRSKPTSSASALRNRRRHGPREVFLLLPAHFSQPGLQERNDDVAVHRTQVIESGEYLHIPPGLDELTLVGGARF